MIILHVFWWFWEFYWVFVTLICILMAIIEWNCDILKKFDDFCHFYSKISLNLIKIQEISIKTIFFFLLGSLDINPIPFFVLIFNILMMNSKNILHFLMFMLSKCVYMSEMRERLPVHIAQTQHVLVMWIQSHSHFLFNLSSLCWQSIL